MGDELFQWRRKTNPLSVARGENEKDNVQRWIKKVQEASDAAAREVLGEEFTTRNQLRSIIPEDDALWEAQELVDSWLKEKTLTDLQLEVEYKDEGWAGLGQPILNSEKFLEDFDTKDINDYKLGCHGNIAKESELNSDLLFEDADDSSIVGSILTSLLKKDYISKQVLDDVGMNPQNQSYQDPRPGMEIRHIQVKDRGEERRKQMQKRRAQQIEKKEAQRRAKQIIMNEEKQKKRKAKMEEDLIQHEMAKIRKEMEEEKKLIKDKEKRRRAILDEARSTIEEEERQKREKEAEEERKAKEFEDCIRREILKDLEEKSVAEELLERKLKHKYFSSWHALILRRRVQLGKARALADWKAKLRAWNAWKAFVAHLKSTEEAQAVQLAMAEKYRKEKLAHNHYCFVLLRKSLIGWQLWVVRRNSKRVLKEEQSRQREKMNAFLEAAKFASINNDGTKNMPLSGESRKSSKKQSNATVRRAWGPIENKKNTLTKLVNTTVESENQEGMISDKPSVVEPLSAVANRTLKTLTSYPKLACEKEAVSHFVQVLDNRIKQVSPLVKNDINKQNGNEVNHITRPDTPRSIASSQEGEGPASKIHEELTATPYDIGAAVKSDKPITKPLKLAMEERARRREEKRREAEERKKEAEELRLKQLQEAEQRRLDEERVAKKERLRKKKEEERIRRQIEEEQQKEKIRMQALMRKACEHYSRVLLFKLGMEPWQRLIKISRLNQQIAEKYHARVLTKQCLTEWKNFAEESKKAKEVMADTFYAQLLKKRGFRAFFKYLRHIERLQAVSMRRWQASVLKRYFAAWQHYVTEEQVTMWAKEANAVAHDESRLIKSCFARWKYYLADLKLEEEKEKRRELLRRRVRGWLPDYQGKDVTSQSTIS